MPADSSPHLLIPFAACDAESWLPSVRAMPEGGLKRLEQLLAGMALAHSDCGSAESLSPPHERALGRALGLADKQTADGLVPLAANDAAHALQPSPGQAWAWLTPCHWAMGHLHATLSDPAALALGEGESRELLAIMQPYFETDGITLHYLAPERWLAEGELLRSLPTASLDRVLARNVDAWLPASQAAAPLRRLQNEMQMLLYTHAFNDAREAGGKLPVNSFWISGTGEAHAPALCRTDTEEVTMPRALAQAVFREDWLAYQQAWLALDAIEIGTLLARQQAGETVRLTLCGERNALTFESRRPTLKSRLSRIFRPSRLLDVLEQL